MRRSMARALGVLGLLVPVLGSAEVFVNEIHYDNGGTDAGEAIEVVATAGENLADYRVVLYTGSTGEQYDDDALTTGVEAICGATVRLSVLSYPVNGLQNGDPDGIALVGPGDALVQFLSYDGSFAAVGGPADGVTSTDIGVGEAAGTTTGQSLQLSGSGNSHSAFAWQLPAADSFGACNTGQTFTAAVDVPPTVVSSNPANGGTLPANGTLSVTFSEPVDVTTGWFMLICDSGNRSTDLFDISGGPVTFTIVPQSDLVEGDSCTLGLAKFTTTDRDGSPDPLDPPYDVNFTVTGAIANAPPEVLSTVPADGASAFPVAGDLGVTFSEPVTLAAGAFALECVASSGIVLDYPASGTVISITTGTALDFEDACTFTIDAAAITDAEGATLLPVAPIAFTVAGNAAGSYYDEVNTSSPEQLRCSLHATIDGHMAYPYTDGSTDTWDILNLADEDPLDSTKILDAYRNESYTKITGGTGAYNREHTWPNTYGFSGGDPGPYTDTHMLYLTNVGYNSDRGSKPFADCDSGCTQRATIANHGIGGSSGADSNWFEDPGEERDGSFEVWDHRKGDMARAVLYMAIRYEGDAGEPDLELTDTRSLITSAGSGGKHYMGLLTTLLAWHASDLPDEAERQRNEVVYNFQGNRNPFIDHPEWASLALFQSAQPASCVLGTPDAALFADGFETP